MKTKKKAKQQIHVDVDAGILAWVDRDMRRERAAMCRALGDPRVRYTRTAHINKILRRYKKLVAAGAIGGEE